MNAFGTALADPIKSFLSLAIPFRFLSFMSLFAGGSFNEAGVHLLLLKLFLENVRFQKKIGARTFFQSDSFIGLITLKKMFCSHPVKVQN